MIIYEVDLRIDESVADAYLAWLHSHVAQILRLPGFEGATILACTSLPADVATAESVRNLCVHYRLTDEIALQAYLTEHAPRLRQDALDRFAGKFKVSRRVMQAFA